MPDYRPGEVASLLGVSVDTVRRWADSGGLKTSRTQGGQRLIDGAGLAAFVSSGKAGGARSGPAGGAPSQSMRNRFSGLVTKVTKDMVLAQVEMQAGPHRIVSLISREAADELGLAPGMIAVAGVKATNVSIEIPKG